MEHGFINLTPENIMDEHLCCIIRSRKPHPGVEAKRQWLAERLGEGHVFRKLNVKGCVFIEYAPLETAWTPILGDNYYYIYCLWVLGEHKGHGYGRQLMEYCLDDAKERGKSGVCMLGAEKQILEASGTVLTYDGGVFKFPLASYTRISDDYGNRIHPTLGIEQFHNGVDFAAPKGTAIYAAYDGQVVAATYSNTMGNYVMIDHGGGLYTIYMHASALYVSRGDIVVRGETIAAVGSTGRSTGNHLHFSVRKDGAYTSPWNYLSQ